MGASAKWGMTPLAGCALFTPAPHMPLSWIYP